MTELEALTASVIAAPDDDLPRLVFADKVEESGDPERAEFIRVQCEPCHCLRPGYLPACGRCERVSSLWSADWMRMGLTVPGPWTPHGYDAVTPGRPNCRVYLSSPDNEHLAQAVFRRGFVEAVTLPWADWLAHWPAILAAHPVRRVTLSTMPGVRSDPLTGASVRWQFHDGPPPLVWVDTINPLTPREAAAKLLAAAWGERGVAFGLPPEPPTSGLSGTLTIGGRMHHFSGWSIRTDDEVEGFASNVVIAGDPTVPPPQGVIGATLPLDSDAARGSSRRNAIPPGWRPRFPRPR